MENLINLNELSDKELIKLAIALNDNWEIREKVITYMNYYRGFCITITPYGECSLKDWEDVK